MKEETENNTFLDDFYSIKNNFFKLYASCIPVNGVNRAAIFDLQRSNIHFVPNVLIELLEEFSNENIFNEYASQKESLMKYFNYLYENDLIFCTDEPDNFPSISKKNHLAPGVLDFVTIEADHLQNFKINLLENINVLGVRELIIVQKNIELSVLKKILSLCKKSKIVAITIITPYSKSIEKKEMVEILEGNLRVVNWIFYNALDSGEVHTKINFSDKKLDEILCKRISSIDDFVINTESYIESINRNLYFNKRVYIDDTGFVKHSYDDSNDYGDIKSVSLKKIINSNSILKLWKATKDRILDCKDCEFRYVCPDNRIPIFNKEKNLFIHKTKCNYNTGTNEWN